MSAHINHNADLHDDDAFGQDDQSYKGSAISSGHEDQYHSDGTERPDNEPDYPQPDGNWPDDIEEEYEEEPDDSELNEPAPPVENKERNTKRTRIILALTFGLLALLGIIGMLWKLTLSANGFRAPVPAEPIDVAEKQSNRKNQPTDYADEEQMKTMNYDGVNSIYGLTLKKQQEAARNSNSASDSSRQDPSVQRELARSRQLAGQRSVSLNQSRRSSASGNYATAQRQRSATYSSAYGDPYHANPTHEDMLLRAGFNTVKAEGSTSNGYGGQQPQPFQALASAEIDRNAVEDNEPIPGVVSGDQTIMNGTRVMFRTLVDAKIRDRFAPKGSILVGFAQVGSNRAVFNITTLRLSTGEAVPVRLRALDPDMNEGLALQSDKPARQQADQATNNALSQAAGQAAWSAGYSVNQATRSPVVGNALASLGAGLASAATNGRRREVRQKLSLQDGFKVFFVPAK